MVANRPARRRKLVVPVSPRPSANAGAPIERGFGRSEVATKPELKGNYLLARTASLHRNAITSDAVTPVWRRLSEAAVARRPKRIGNEGRCRSSNGSIPLTTETAPYWPEHGHASANRLHGWTARSRDLKWGPTQNARPDYLLKIRLRYSTTLSKTIANVSLNFAF
jgi:hypothetical protein